MNVLIAPDSFKGSLTAVQAAGIIRESILASDPAVRCTVLPQADGGEGTIDAVHASRGGTIMTAEVPDLGGRPSAVRWLLNADGSGMMESAQCIGWQLPEGVERAPEHLYSTGLGVLLRIVAERCTNISVALGGSATSDCGLGFARALGAVFHTDASAAAKVSTTLASLLGISYPKQQLSAITVLADVRNPLTGKSGAVFSYGPQKGIPETELGAWDAAFEHCAMVIRRDVRDVDQDSEGMGSAGGLGFAVSAFCAAEVLPGADVIRSITGFDDALRGCDLVITGEGRIDAQTLHGKAVQGIAAAAATAGVPVIAIAGQVGPDVAELADTLHLRRIVSLTSPELPPERGLREAPSLLYEAAKNVLQVFHG